MKNKEISVDTSFASLLLRTVRNQITPDDYERLRDLYLSLPIPPSAKTLAKRMFVTACGVGRVLAGKGVTKRFERPFALPCIDLAVQRPDKADYFVFGIIDWWHLQQRPQHLSRGLAALGHRVFFISPQLKHADHKGFEAESLDAEGRLFSIRIQAYFPYNIHYKAPGKATVAELLHSIGELLCWTASGRRVFLVEHPAWYSLVSCLPGGMTIYDCMDYHEGFGAGEDVALRTMENALLASSELTIVTSQWLEDAVKDIARKTVIVRNAGEYTHFSTPPEHVAADPQGRRTLGYYGTIGEWFDFALIEKLALEFSDCRLLLIGNDTVNAKGRLQKYSNIVCTGKIPYEELPSYLYAFDVCLLPFLPILLIQATNPVKVYEYLSAGKPVVSIDIPEMSQFEGLVYIAKDKNSFIKQVRQALLYEDASDLPEKRQKFARGQTWLERTEHLAQAVDSLVCRKKVSIIVVTYNNLHLTKTCLESVERYTHNPNREIIVVDNASSDGTPEFLRIWQEGHADRHVLLNSDNRGFAAANNQGLDMSSGEYLVLLNNDTYVTPGWDLTLMHHLKRNPSLGLLCPVTNNIGNEAKIKIAYNGMGEMLDASRRYTCRHAGKLYPLSTTAFFCVMMPRVVFASVGPVCEEYGRGWFEDDDYCRRAERLGYSMACAEDVFVHHELSASFNALPGPEKVRLFKHNKAIYENKWGAWVPHRSRPV